MARYLEVHPDNPQPRRVTEAADIVRGGGLIAYPTDSCFAFGWALGATEAQERVRRIRKLEPSHHFTIAVAQLAQLGPYVEMDNQVFRAVRAAEPGRYTFILPATRELPRSAAHPKRRSVGVRILGNVTARALLAELGAPLTSSTLTLPEINEPMTQGWEIKDRLDHELDAVLDSGDCGADITTVVDLTGDEPVVVRVGGGDPAPFLP